MKRTILSGVLVIAVATLVIATSSSVAPTGFLRLVLAIAVIIGVLIFPRAVVPALFVALLLQGALVRNLERTIPELAAVLQSLDEIALVAALARVVSSLIVRSRERWFEIHDWYWPIAFALTGLTSSVLHWSGFAPAAVGLALACKLFGFIALAQSVEWHDGDGDFVVKAAAWLVPCLLVTGVVGYLSPDVTAKYFAAVEGDTDYGRGGLTSFMLPFINPGLYGWAMSVGTLAWFALVLERRSARGLIGVVGGALGAILSLRRRPLLALPTAMLSAMASLGRRARVLAVAILLLIIGGGAWIGAGSIRATIEDTVENYLDPIAREQTARGALHAGAFLLAERDFPLGAGFGRFGGYASQLYYSSVYDELGMSSIYGLSPDTPYYITDTYWPHLLGEVGVIGTLAMIVALWQYWRAARKAYLSLSASPSTRLLALFVSLILVEAAIESLGGPIFEYPLQTFAIGISIGMLLRLARTRRAEPLSVSLIES